MISFRNIFWKNNSKQVLASIGAVLVVSFIGAQQILGNGIVSDTDVVDDFNGHYLLAHHYLARADFKLAELELEQSIAKSPESSKAHRDLFVVSLLRLNFPQALAEFMMTVGLGKPIPFSGDEMVALNTACAKAHYRKAIKYEEQNRFAREIFELSLANYYAPHSVIILRSLAFAYGKSGRFLEAYKLYQESFNLNPQQSTEDAYAHADYAFLLAANGQQDLAINQLYKAIEIEPKAAPLHADLAWFYETKGDLKQATDEIEQAIRVSKTSPEQMNVKMPASHKLVTGYGNLWAHLGKLLDKQNKPVEAKQAYEEALRLNPQDQDIKSRLAELQKVHTPSG